MASRPWLKVKRRSLGMSQQELADEVGVSRQQVSEWENGHATPGGDNMTALADVLGETMDWIASGPKGGGHAVVRESGDIEYDPRPDPEGSPAEQIMALLGQKVGMRRLAGALTSKDLIAVAYTLAREEGFGPEEWKKLDAWRDEILEEERRSS